MDPKVLSRTRERLEALRQVLPKRGGVFIVPHDYPDPDAFASAAALHLLLQQSFGVKSRIVFTGDVSRAENREMLRHSRYAWYHLSDLRPRRQVMPCLLVDAHPAAANVTLPGYGRAVAVIDHHPPPRNQDRQVPYQDIRTETGATATILYEYLACANVTVPTWLASLMVYAIATETLDLSRNWTEEDREAYVALVARANMRVLGQIRHAPLPRDYYVQLQDALKNTFTYGRVAWAHIERAVQPEIIPEIADLLGRMERVTWSFCTGYYRDELLVSLRSSLPSTRCGRILGRALAMLGGAGGGHDWMAAGAIGVSGLGRSEQESLRERLIEHLLRAIEKRPVQKEALLVSDRMLVPPRNTAARSGASF